MDERELEDRKRALYAGYLSRCSGGHDYSGVIVPSKTLLSKKGAFHERCREFFSSKPQPLALSVSAEADHKWICQRMILILSEMRGGRIWWDSVTAFQVVEEWMGDNTPVVKVYSEPDLLFIVQGRGEVSNKQLVPLVNAIVSTRELKGRFTVVLSYGGGSELVPSPISVLAWMGGKDGASKASKKAGLV